METNRERLERLGMMDDETIDALTEEVRCDYCPLPEYLKGVHCYGGNPIMCEGTHCQQAIENWLDEEADKED